jgi:hypothetical protein
VDFNINKKYKLLLRSAKTRGLKVYLNLEHYKQLLNLGCMYCGQDLQNQNGYCLDRIDNTLGYLDRNVTPCCKICNMAKGDKTVKEFISWIEKAYKFQKELLSNLELEEKQYKKQENIFFNKKKIKESVFIKLT